MKTIEDVLFDLEYKIDGLKKENTAKWKSVSILGDRGAYESNGCAGYERALDDVLELMNHLIYEDEEW